jgi:hypothetical protein
MMPDWSYSWSWFNQNENAKCLHNLIFFLHAPNYAKLGPVFSNMTSSKGEAIGQTSTEISFDDVYQKCCSQWPRSLRRGSAAARLLVLWIRVLPGEWMSVCCECCLLAGRGLCDEIITRVKEFYRVWLVQRPLPDNTQHSQQADIHAPRGIRTHISSKWAAQSHDLDSAATGFDIQILCVPLIFRQSVECILFSDLTVICVTAECN